MSASDPDPAVWNAARWQALCGRLGLPAQDPACGRFEALAQAYAQPWRAYHTARHIAECLTLLDRVAAALHDAPLVELALWLHDVVYDPRRQDNEARSAGLAAQWLGGLAPQRLARLQAWIEATREHAPAPDDADLQALLDIDLAILAAPPARFADYAQQVRHEYAWVPDAVFAAGRQAFLGALAARPRLYFHPALAPGLEAPARANLAQALQALAASPGPAAASP